MSARNTHILLALMALVLLGSACKPGDDDTQPSFDQGPMFSNLSSNIIVPRYTELNAQLDALKASVDAFIAAPDAQGLTELQEALHQSWLAWQACSAFEFGPAEDVILRSSMNTFPADTSQITSNISSGSYDLDAASNADAQGFPALDYLLHRNDAATTLALFTTDSDAANRLDLLEALVQRMQSKTATVLVDWSNYAATFNTNTGTDVGSSLGLLVNQLNFDWEIVKDAKIGIPLGIKTLGTPLPANVEAYYSGHSVEYATVQVKALRDLYLGTGPGQLGLDDYLVALNARHGDNALNDDIKAGFTAAINALEAIADPLSDAVINQQSLVQEAYNKLQQQVVLLKTDMSSALAVLITYQDNDGD